MSLIKYVKQMDCDVVITTRLEQSKIVNKYCKKDILKIASEHNHHNNDKNYIEDVFNTTKDIDKLVLISEELYYFYRELFKNEKVECVNIKHFVELSKVENTPQKEVISVGRLSVEKGYSDLLKVAKIMPDIKFNIVGNGLLKEELDDIISREQLKNIALHGSLSNKEIIELTKKCFAYVMSSHTESFGLVLIEALSSGVPCVAFDSAKGACEIIESGVNGFLISDRNIEEFAQKVYECEKNFQALSNNAVKIVDKYSYDLFYREWNNIIKK